MDLGTTITSLLVVATLATAAGVPLLAPADSPQNGSQGNSNAQPANKVVGAGSKLVVLGPGEEVSILEASVKTSKPTDMVFSVSLECSILTRLVTGPSEEGGSDSALASGVVRVWVEVDGFIVPINSASEPPQDPPAAGGVADKVTFCSRTYSRTVMDAEDPQDGQDIEDDYIDTKNANAFNWIRLNMGSGTHDIVVKADLTETAQGDATAEAAIGNRVLVAEPTKLANNAVV